MLVHFVCITPVNRADGQRASASQLSRLRQGLVASRGTGIKIVTDFVRNLFQFVHVNLYLLSGVPAAGVDGRDYQPVWN